MPIPLTCPTCGYSAPAPDTLAGQYVRCPRCRTGLVVAGSATAKRPRRSAPLSLGAYVVSTILGALAMLALLALLVAAISRPDLLCVVFIVAVGLLMVVWVCVLLPAWWGRDLGKSRSIGAHGGFALGLLLGWLGVVIVALYPEQQSAKQCPYCAEWVKVEARVCKHCGRDLVPTPTP